MKKKVILGLSGGVDSSVAAWLLKEQNYEVEALFMKNWEQDDTETHCAAAVDLADAESVATLLGIKLHKVNFAREYWDNVFNHFLEEYKAGRTPNPDVLCNKEIKFKAFYQHAMALGADLIATGHYAKVTQDNEGPHLLKSKDREKDQTYFLHAISREALSKTLFPVGDYLKTEIRQMAEKLKLPIFNKKDSTGICFIGEKRFKNFLNEYLLKKPGKICTPTGETLGEHEGLMFYTLGQRQGIGIGGCQDKAASPWYVVDKDIASNTLIVGQGNDNSLLYSSGLIASPIHWLTEPPDFPLGCYAKTRYRQTEQPCLVSPATDNQHCVMFSSPQRAVTPGQYIVFYDKNRCLGGAMIDQIIR